MLQLITNNAHKNDVMLSFHTVFCTSCVCSKMKKARIWQAMDLYIACAVCFCLVLIYKGLQNCCDVMQK